MPSATPRPLVSYATEKSTQSQYIFAQRATASASGKTYAWHMFRRGVTETQTRHVFASLADADAWRAAQDPSDSVTCSVARRINDCGWAEILEASTEYGDWTDIGEVGRNGVD